MIFKHYLVLCILVSANIIYADANGIVGLPLSLCVGSFTSSGENLCLAVRHARSPDRTGLYGIFRTLFFYSLAPMLLGFVPGPIDDGGKS